MKPTSNNLGQTVLEVLVAATIVTVLLVGLLSLIVNSSKSTTYSRNLNQATEYSNQAADWLRNQKKQYGWSAFIEAIQNDSGANTVTYCLNNSLADFEPLAAGSCSSTYISGTNFSREAIMNLSNVADGTIDITITTSWQETNDIQNATVNTKLTQWK